MVAFQVEPEVAKVVRPSCVCQVRRRRPTPDQHRPWVVPGVAGPLRPLLASRKSLPAGSPAAPLLSPDAGATVVLPPDGSQGRC